MRQGFVLKANTKIVSILLLALATLLATIDIIDIKMVFGKNEVGLFDSMPGFVTQVMFISYPICLLSSYILFTWTRKVKTKYDGIANIFYFLNGIVILLLLVISLPELLKHL